MTKTAQYSEDKKKWSFGGAAPFKWVRFIVIDKGERTVTAPVEIEETKRDPVVFGYTPK